VIQITRLTKRGGPLTKRIFLTDDGTYQSDGSACVMSAGEGWRVDLAGVRPLADLIAQMAPHEAIALGALRPDLPDKVTIVTKGKLNGSAHPGIVARTGSAIAYRDKQPAFALLDFDTKGIPPEVSSRLLSVGGYWAALMAVLPQLADIAHVTRRSTSAGLYREDTGEKLPGSYGLHIYVLVADGADVVRFLADLHARCWLAGLGWMMIGAGGQLLERSIVDRMVGAPERLVFEGAPLLQAPLAQDADSRRPVATAGAAFDTVRCCPPLTILETARLREMRAREAQRLAASAAKARDEFITTRAQALSVQANMSVDRARQVIARQCAGTLLPSFILPFDDPALVGVTVGQVLADPGRYEGETLADPNEGVDYGRCTARIMRRPDGTPWIHSFAHGRTIYTLQHDAAAIEAAIAGASDDTVVDHFVRLVCASELAEHELEQLRNRVAERAGVNKRTIDKMIRAARQEAAGRSAREEDERRRAERLDPRPQVPAPAFDAPWLPQMAVLNGVLGAVAEAEPPMRDMDGVMMQVRNRRALALHTLTAAGANEGEVADTRLPAPEQPLLTRLDETQLAELIERHLDYVDEKGRSVHLAPAFVKHYLVRTDEALPAVSAVATLPIVLPDGAVLAGRGLVRERGIVFRVPDELTAIMPSAAACNREAVAEALQFLTEEWLCDVATDWAGKCSLVALLATIVERLALPERPAFNINAGQRGGGKTTAANMVAMAALGRRAAAAAWSPSTEERRKALLAYLAEGVPFLVWDNIPRGEIISCSSIERALTAESYSDRVLGASEQRTVSAATIQAFTGNNIAAEGDLASRTLGIRLEVDRPDPENRVFKHADPLAWTEANRGRILAAVYTILLGNPRLREKSPAPAQTRFKAWWHLVGSAVEHAAKCCDVKNISFRSMFLDGEEGMEQGSGLAEVLNMLRCNLPEKFKAADVADFMNIGGGLGIALMVALERVNGDKPFKSGVISAVQVTWYLKALVGTPVRDGDDIWKLNFCPDRKLGGLFEVTRQRLREAEAPF
jgi:hypothetical protein